MENNQEPQEGSVVAAVPNGSPALGEEIVYNSPVVDPKRRKCRDVCCLIFAVLFMIGVVVAYLYYIVIADDLKVDGKPMNLHQIIDRSMLYLRPGDQLRRICGTDQQVDVLASDYSEVIKNEARLNVLKSAFCPVEAGKDWDSWSLDCLNGMKSPEFSANQMKAYGSSVYVKDQSYCLEGEVECASITNEYSRVCHRDFYDIITAISGKPLYHNVDGKVAERETIGDIAQYLEGKKQLFTKEKFQELLKELDAVKIGNESQTLAFLGEFCGEIPHEENLDDNVSLYIDYVSINKIVGAHECIFDYSIGVNAFVAGVSEVKWASESLQYVSNFFSDVMNNIIIEFRENWGYILIGLAVTIIFSYLFMFFIKFMASVLIWFAIIALLCSCFLGAYVLITMGQNLLEENDFRIENYGYSDPRVSSQGTALMTCGSIIAAVGIVLLLMLCCFFKSIRVAIAVLKVSSDCFRRLFGVVVLPLFFIPVILVHLLWTVTGAFLFQTLGYFDVKYNSFDFKKVEFDSTLNEFIETYQSDRLVCFLLIVFMVIWGVFFFYSVLEYIISAMVVKYYFAVEKKERVLGFAFKCCFKSLGTLCVSSFITSFVVWVRFVFEYVMRRLNRSEAVRENKVIESATHVVRCLLKCLQKFVQYTNRNAQILAVISGEGYFKSCKNALIFQLSQFKHVFVLNTLGDFFLALSKIVAAAVTAVAVYFMIGAEWFGDKTMVVVPTFCAAILGYVVAFYIFEIFELVIDSIFMCYVYENENLKGDRERGMQSFAPQALRDLLDGRYGSCCKKDKKGKK